MKGPAMRGRVVRPLIMRSAVLLAAAILGGCGSAEPTYYTLRSWPGVAQGGVPLTIQVRTPTVSSFLDRDYIVRNDKDYRLKLAEDSVWGEPIAGLIGSTLTADLQQRLPGSTVFTDSGAVSTHPQAVVELDVSQFSEDGAGLATIDAALSVQRPDAGAATSQLLHLSMAPSGPTTADLAAALSQLLGQVADAAARQASALAPLPADPVRG